MKGWNRVSGRISIKCPICKEWMTSMSDLCDECRVVQIRLGMITIKEEEE